MIVIKFEGSGETFIRELSEGIGRTPQDASKFCFVLMAKIMAIVVGRGRTISLSGDIFAPYENIIIAPGDKMKKNHRGKPTGKVLKFPSKK